MFGEAPATGFKKDSSCLVKSSIFGTDPLEDEPDPPKLELLLLLAKVGTGLPKLEEPPPDPEFSKFGVAELDVPLLSRAPFNCEISESSWAGLVEVVGAGELAPEEDSERSDWTWSNKLDVSCRKRFPSDAEEFPLPVEGEIFPNPKSSIEEDCGNTGAICSWVDTPPEPKLLAGCPENPPKEFEV